MTLQEALTVKQGQILYQSGKFGSDNRLSRWKVTSIKTWKRQPEKIVIRVKHGQFNFGQVTQDHLELLQLTDEVKPKKSK